MDAPPASIVPAQTLAEFPRFASWLRQSGAFAIDIVIVSVVPLVVAFVALGKAAANDDLYDALDVFVGGLVLAVVVLAAGSTLYFTLLVGRRGQTGGMRIVGIAVRDARDVTQTIGYGRALGRWLFISAMWSLYAVPGAVDLLSPLWDQRRQSWHDKIASSLVIRI